MGGQRLWQAPAPPAPAAPAPAAPLVPTPPGVSHAPGRITSPAPARIPRARRHGVSGVPPTGRCAPVWRVWLPGRVNTPPQQKSPQKGAERLTASRHEITGPTWGRFSICGALGGRVWRFPPWWRVNGPPV